MIIVCIILAVKLNIQNSRDWEMFNIAIVIGLAAKALSNVVLLGNYREGAVKIIMAVGLLIALFASMEGGISLGTLIEAAPGLVIVGLGWLAKKFPKIIAAALFLVTAVMLVVVLGKGLTIGQITTALILSVPLITAGVCLLVGDKN